MPQYGKVTRSMADEIVNAEGMTANSYRLIVWILPLLREESGFRKKPHELSIIRSWEERNGIQHASFCQFTVSQACESLGWDSTEVRRQVGRLVGAGVLAKVGAATRGHAQVYAVCPMGGHPDVPAIETLMGGHPDVPATGGNERTSGAEWEDIGGRMGGHTPPSEQGKRFLSISNKPEYINQDENEEETGKERKICPHCGSTDYEAQPFGYLCRKCMTAFRY